MRPARFWRWRHDDRVRRRLAECQAGRLLRRHLHAGRDQRAVRRHGTATRRLPLGRDDRGVAPSTAIGGQEHLVVGALHSTVGRVAGRSNHPNAERRARRTGRTGFATRPLRAGGPRIALRPLPLSATRQGGRQYKGNEQAEHRHGRPSEGAGDSMSNFARHANLERDDFSSSHHPALGSCFARDPFRKPVPTFRDHALGDGGVVSYRSRSCRPPLITAYDRPADRDDWRSECRPSC
jgi:hypothetical protein